MTNGLEEKTGVLGEPMSNWELDLLGTESLIVGEGRAILAEGTANARDTSEHHGRLAWREGGQKSREWPKM